jgi:hypothetical protein
MVDFVTVLAAGLERERAEAVEDAAGRAWRLSLESGRRASSSAALRESAVPTARLEEDRVGRVREEEDIGLEGREFAAAEVGRLRDAGRDEVREVGRVRGSAAARAASASRRRDDSVPERARSAGFTAARGLRTPLSASASSAVSASSSASRRRWWFSTRRCRSDLPFSSTPARYARWQPLMYVRLSAA